MVRSWCAVATFASMAVAGSSQAGLDGSGLSFTDIAVGGGYVDLDSMDPFGSDYADFIDLNDPSPGSFLEVSATDPGFGAMNSGISFGSFSNGLALFSFWSEIEALPFGSIPDVDAAFAGGGISFTTEVPVIVFLIGSVQASASGRGFFGNYFDDGVEDWLFDANDNPAYLEIELGPGSYTFGFGSVTPPIGGYASFEGTIAIEVVPSPGVMALLGLAGLAARRRRR